MAQFPGMTPQRPGVAPPPFRAKPGAQKGKPPLMADGGGIGKPKSPFGGGPPQAAPLPPDAGAAPPDMEPDADDTGGGGGMVVKPEAVHYHDDPQNCQTCQYMGDDGQCSVLRMQVSPDGGCDAFEAKGGGDQDMSGGMMPPAGGGGMPPAAGAPQ